MPGFTISSSQNSRKRTLKLTLDLTELSCDKSQIFGRGVQREFVACPWDTRVIQCMRILQVNIRTSIKIKVFRSLCYPWRRLPKTPQKSKWQNYSTMLSGVKWGQGTRVSSITSWSRHARKSLGSESKRLKMLCDVFLHVKMFLFTIRLYFLTRSIMWRCHFSVCEFSGRLFQGGRARIAKRSEHFFLDVLILTYWLVVFGIG